MGITVSFTNTRAFGKYLISININVNTLLHNFLDDALDENGVDERTRLNVQFDAQVHQSVDDVASDKEEVAKPVPSSDVV